jgi:ligand-binding sensor domain-containing protein
MVEPHVVNQSTPGSDNSPGPVLETSRVLSRSLVVLSLLVFASVSLLSQQGLPVVLDPQKSLTQYTHQIWETDKTPLEGAIRAILQTRDGYVWIGTQEGLYRFNGEHFSVYNTVTTREMKNRSVYALAEDRDGTLWIATRDGLITYRESNFKRYRATWGLV